jgi:hypothetical protein
MNYYYKDVGIWIMGVMGIGILGMSAVLIWEGFNLGAIVGIGVLIIVCVLFGAMTIEINDRLLKVVFGIGIIRKTVALQDIDRCSIVEIPWYYGWGIRLTPCGWLYRLSGSKGVLVTMKTGKQFQIGLMDPLPLQQAVTVATSRFH